MIAFRVTNLEIRTGASMPTYRIEIAARAFGAEAALSQSLRDAGLADLKYAERRRLFFLDGALSSDEASAIARGLIVDPVTEVATVASCDAEIAVDGGRCSIEVHLKPGVMDPAAETTLAELRAEGLDVAAVRTAWRYLLETAGAASDERLAQVAGRCLANDCIERIVVGTDGVRSAIAPPVTPFALRTVSLRDLCDGELETLSRDGHLFLSLAEMQAIRAYFREQERDPTDLELETLAQTWSEHCVHKTLKSAYRYFGPAFGAIDPAAPHIEHEFENLLGDTIARATRELMAAGRGPECLSIFVDNAGVIAFDETDGVAFKVETHNHPSAIEPYGGAATGIGGCIRDVLGCGLGARPIANTDVFCVAPGDWRHEHLPAGVLHPERVLRGIVQGVADYGNRMGIPTVNGAVHFDPRYLGNPLVYCGCVGILPRDRLHKAAQPGDRIVVLGGRTGRDGIHGATFSSAELTTTHADEFSHAVQIGNAITEKRVLDAVMAARDHADGCLYNAITDCGAGGLSSAIGEMGEDVGALVDLEHVPLKYPGLRYDEIWISEAQERMVLAVPPDKVAAMLDVARAEAVEATVVGAFGTVATADADAATLTWSDLDAPTDDQPAELIVRCTGQVVGRVDMAFLHEGVPTATLEAQWTPPAAEAGAASELSRSGLPDDWPDRLQRGLGSPTSAAKAWIIRKYDHEVQGGSVIKPLGGPGEGPNDAAVIRPKLESARAVAIGCGLCPELSDADPYWMALNAMDEAIRNVVCVGGDPARTAVLDNFCWGRVDDLENRGALVRACQACYDGALAYGTPFISGKDSLNNALALGPEDLERVLASLAARADLDAATRERLQRRIAETGRIEIPATLLISALSLIDDARRCVSADLKEAGDALLLVGGLPRVGFDVGLAARVHAALHDLIRSGAVRACHDVSDGGWLGAVAEMAIGGLLGVELAADIEIDGFGALAASYVLETGDPAAVNRALSALHKGVEVVQLGAVIEAPAVRCGERMAALAELDRVWRGG